MVERPGTGDTDQGAGSGDEHPDPGPPTPDPVEWRLASGVWLVEGTAVGAGAAVDEHVYTLVLPDGRRYQVSEPLYRLAELLECRLSLQEVAARLSERLGRPLTVADVAGLVERKLVPQHVVTPR